MEFGSWNLGLGSWGLEFGAWSWILGLTLNEDKIEKAYGNYQKQQAQGATGFEIIFVTVGSGSHHQCINLVGWQHKGI